VEVSNIFLGAGVNLDQVKPFTMWRPFQVGDLTITPYLMDHSAPDAAAFLIEADGQRLFYTGDFRGHGRKRVLLERLLTNPIFKVECLIMEGSMIGREEGRYQDEESVEQAIYDVIANQQSYVFVFCSSQNLDRLVSVYRAVKKGRKALVIDLYTAFVLDKLSSISSNIPQFDWKEIRVLYAYSHAKKLAEYDRTLLYKYRQAKIEWEEIKATPQGMVILCKDNFYFRRVILPKLGASSAIKAIYSMWRGYLERTNLAQFLKSRSIELLEIHTSGHAYEKDLKRLARVLAPSFVVPIHTFHPGQYGSIYDNIVRLEDGQIYCL
jgi:ribonuclease J